MLATDEIKTKKELLQHHNEQYKYKVSLKTRPVVDYALLLDMVEADQPTHRVKALRYLAETITCYNIWIGTKEELQKGLGVGSDRARAILRELQGIKSLIVTDRPTKGRNLYRIEVAPWYGWNAQANIREVFLENYIKKIRTSSPLLVPPEG